MELGFQFRKGADLQEQRANRLLKSFAESSSTSQIAPHSSSLLRVLRRLVVGGLQRGDRALREQSRQYRKVPHLRNGAAQILAVFHLVRLASHVRHVDHHVTVAIVQVVRLQVAVVGDDERQR
jgi:hypothetical protein